ncbi:MAG: ATP-grasp domain-containing protein [Acidimicrobiia bacterium]|nr:ATP-grasp domain-containing protein [Acidimicrobiia bacterium]
MTDEMLDMKLLVANRGEIARRVMRTARRLGMATVAVYAEPDATAPFVAEADEAVLIGPADLSQSYLSMERILAAATETAASAVHPGYGFLSENAEFAKAVIDAGLVWVGPHPGALESMGGKIEARRIAERAGVPIIPGFDSSQDPDDLAKAAADIGYPVLVKAAAGGGGKGIRIVNEPSAFAAGLAEARAEAERSFGNSDMIVERYITRPRHVEVQVVGDKHGSVIDLGTRECSVQRRYQKLFEEAPAPNLPPATRQGLRDRGRALAEAINYDSAGTVEFIVDDETGDFYFLEMNTRLQVEHPVTEFVTGLDLVELQLRSALGQPLPVAQDDVRFEGHAVEARINAEDPASGFTPQIGTVSHLVVPDGVRWDSAIEAGSTISPHYDSMVAKLIVGGADRTEALAGLRAALDGLVVGGLTTNTGFHRWLADQPPLTAGRITTRFLDETDIPAVGADQLDAAAGTAAATWLAHVEAGRSAGPWGRLGTFSLTPRTSTQTIALRHHTGEVIDVAIRDLAANGGGTGGKAVVDLDPGSHRTRRSAAIAVNVAGATHTFEPITRSERWAPDAAAAGASAGAIVAPFHAVVAEIRVGVGDPVAGGDVVIVIEAMKMLHSLSASGAGTVDEIRVAVGDQVEGNQTLVTFVVDDDET